MIACKNSGREVNGDFVEVNKIVKVGVTSKQVKDYHAVGKKVRNAIERVGGVIIDA
ncbi:hypothetical protein FACS1894187_16610 [Synergistales bacterium]|nr:hypothetical protein FACS1894187_16610 [Synergistales bacterium]